MAKFLSVPTEIEAIQFNGSLLILEHQMKHLWPGTATLRRVRRKPDEGQTNKVQLYVDANGEWLTLEKFEWVIRDELGFYPCKNEVFQKKYKAVEND